LTKTLVTKKVFVSTFPNCMNNVVDLEKLNLLPLFIENTKSFRLFVKILGFRYADSCIYNQKRNRSFTFALYFGKISDAKNLCKDFYNIIGIKKEPKLNKSSGTYVVYLPASFARLCICAGSPIGDKTLQSFPIPKWIFGLEDELKWEFLDGLFSGDGAAPRLKSNSNSCESLKLSLNSDERFVKKFAKQFMADTWKLIESLDVKASRPNIEWNSPTIGKDGSVTYPVTIRILTRKENMLRFLENVHYSYACGASEKTKLAINALKGENLKKDLKNFLTKNGKYALQRDMSILLQEDIQKSLIEYSANKLSQSRGKYSKLAEFLYQDSETIKLDSIRDKYIADWRYGKKFIPLSYVKILSKLAGFDLRYLIDKIRKVKLLRAHNKYAVPFCGDNIC